MNLRVKILGVVFFIILFTSVPSSFAQLNEPETCSDIFTADEILDIINLEGYKTEQREPTDLGNSFEGLVMSCHYSAEPEVYEPEKTNQIFTIGAGVLVFESAQHAQNHHDFLKETVKSLEQKVVTSTEDGWTLRTMKLYDDEPGVQRPSIADHTIQITAIQDRFVLSFNLVSNGDKSLADETILQEIFSRINDNLISGNNPNYTPQPPIISNQPAEPVDNPNEEGGGCLIATAAYGSEMAPKVQYLRELRDETVLSTQSGIAFMTGFNQIYYSFSPTIADIERQNPGFQDAVRMFITPMISSLSILDFAEQGSESQVLGLGLSIIALNLGIYIVGPTITISKIYKKVIKNN